MIVKIAERRHRFAQIPNELARDKRLSWQARGMMLYLLSHDENWEIRFDNLCNESPRHARKTIRRIFRELRQFGYAELRSLKHRSGRWLGKQYHVLDCPAVTDETSQHGASRIPPFWDGRQKGGMSKKTDERQRQKNTDSDESKIRRNGTFFSRNGETSPFLVKCSAKLEEHVRKSRKIDKRFKRQRWHDQFRQLLEELGGDRARLKAVLRGYLTEPHDQFTPQADSAEGFRNKFTKIERWLKRATGMDEDEEISPKPRIKVVIED